VRTDGTLTDASFRNSTEWKKDAVGGGEKPEIDARLAGDEMRDGKLVVHSLSGHERNRLFLNEDGGKAFGNLSALSGLDNPADSRGFALLDYDRDGWQDVALVNANAPLTNLYHNEMREAGATGGMLALRFVGGNTTAGPSEFACRDGYGARVEIDLGGGRRLLREHRCGEGYGAQNSATLVVGIGALETVPSVTVVWPSGKRTTVENVAEGTLLTAFENRPAEPFTPTPYRVVMKGKTVADAEPVTFPLAAEGEGTGLRVYTTTATWCGSCLVHLPELELLKKNGVALVGVPIDPEDSVEKLAAYVEKWHPAYKMAALDEEKREAVNAFLVKHLKTQNPPLPSSIVTDGKGRVLAVMRSVPTLSALRKLEHPS
jgi:thiol-disulfide isomerase/thioredoxin